MPLLNPDQALGYWRTASGLVARIDDHYKGRFYGLVDMVDGSLRKTIWDWDFRHGRLSSLDIVRRKREHEKWNLSSEIQATGLASRRQFLYGIR